MYLFSQTWTKKKIKFKYNIIKDKFYKENRDIKVFLKITKYEKKRMTGHIMQMQVLAMLH